MKKEEATQMSGNSELDNSDNTAIKPPIKMELCITLLIQRGESGLTQPEAYSVYEESCLHTSISTLQNKHGLIIARSPDKSTAVHYRQKPFYRYWLADEYQSQKALVLLNHYRTKRGLTPIPRNKAA